MSPEEIQNLNQRARIKLYKEHAYKDAFEIYKLLSEEDYPAAYFNCGLILEKGWLEGKPDLDGALPYFTKLAVRWNDSEGYLGVARIILAKRDVMQRDKALRYCIDATRMHGLRSARRAALLVLGRIYEEMTDPPERGLARKAYAKAFFSGSAWALRKYAVSLMESRYCIRGTLMHVIATIVSPVMVLVLGRGTLRKG